MTLAYLSVGSNINPEINVIAAIKMLSEKIIVLRISSVYRSEAETDPAQPHYYNCVVEIDTNFEPLDVKYRILRPIESTLKRERTSDKYAPRTIDLDLIIYGHLVLDSVDLTLPDPSIQTRPFLALPLYELAPHMILPPKGLSLSKIVKSLPNDRADRLDEFSARLQSEKMTTNQKLSI